MMRYGRWRDPSGGRALTDGERALAIEAFGTALETSGVRIHHATWWPLQPPAVAMAPDGDLWLPPGGGLWREDFAAASLPMQALFVHELTHAWQAARGGRWFLALARHPFCRYAYTLTPGKPFHRYGIEQQAEIVRHAFLLRRGLAVPGKPSLAAYQAVLPFG